MTTECSEFKTCKIKIFFTEVTSELKSLIRKHLAEELRQIKVNVEEKIKQTEEEIGKRLETSETGKLMEKTENKPLAKEKKPKAQQWFLDVFFFLKFYRFYGNKYLFY